jgi:prolyl 4-hydroxylase
MNCIDQAYELASQRKAAAAVALLEEGGRSGDAACWVELASWYLGGNIIPRDLKKCRESFRLAGDAGHQRARSIYISLLANGTGGPAEWQAALGLLAEGSIDNADSRRDLDLIDKMDLNDRGHPRNLAPPELLSNSPDVRIFRRLLSVQECQYLIDRAMPFFEPSVIVDPTTGQFRPHPVRTSENMSFPWIDESPAIHAINQRLATASDTPVANGEPLQILRYSPGQEYRAHHDALPHTDNQRILTMLVYLNDGFEGGETKFLKTGLSVKGDIGDALLFRNADKQGRPDPNALHAGLPVRAGQKLIASRWIHEKRFGPL